MSSTFTIRACFTFRDIKSKNIFIEFSNGEKGFSVTRSYKGNISVECFEKSDDPLSIILVQKWESEKEQNEYINFRRNEGFFDFLQKLITKPPDVSPIRPMILKTDHKQIEQIIEDMCNKDHNVGMKHMTDECLFIRPTGNPLNKEQWDSMMNNDDVTVESNKLISINKMEITNDMAYVVYTNHGKFNYKGTENDDIAVLTAVLKRIDGCWKLVHGQRSTGRKPTDDMPIFDSKNES